MARILAIDDDLSTRLLLDRMLRLAGHEVELAGEGTEGLAKIRSRKPDAVLCDINMPGVDGFRVLECVRADAGSANLPFVIVSALDDREHVRRGLRLGADDYVSKPIDREELFASVTRALDKRHRMSRLVAASALAEREQLSALYRTRLESSGPPVIEEAQGAITGRLMQQTVLFSDTRGFTSICERLAVVDIAELVTRYMREVCDPITREGGHIVKLLGDGVMAVFGRDAPDDVAIHAAAALRAGQQIVAAARNFRQWLNARFELTGLRDFTVGVGIHTGKVMHVRMMIEGVGEMNMVGDTVNVAARLEGQCKILGWPVVASMDAVRAAGPGFEVIETRDVVLPGRESAILVGRLEGAPEVRREGVSPMRGAGVEALLQENARSTAEAAKHALDQTLGAIGARASAGRPPAEPLIRGYRVLGTIAEGGMSTTYMATQEREQRKAVLKVLRAPRQGNEILWKRLFQEYEILSAIDHNHVVHIYDQGFGDQFAYIAMEHLSGGTLAALIARGLTERQALALLSQAASGLAEIHARGVVHRDIKPANLMLRDEAVLVLADFGVARRLEIPSSDTGQCEVLGTPYYLSPEQAQGADVTPASDVYSLGVVFYEMLTRQRPFVGGSIDALLSQHVNEPAPRLPAEFSACQSLLDGMLAKSPADRPQDGSAVLVEIDRTWTERALRQAP